MIDESPNPFEEELRRFSPAPLSAELAARLRKAPAEEKLTLADRTLVFFSTMGAVAAAVVLTTVLSQLSSPSLRPASAADRADLQKWSIESRQLLASR